MKKLLTLVSLVIVLCNQVSGQTNLIPNPSFEDSVGCPNAYSQMAKCKDWYQFTQATSDYFRVCAPSNFVGIPQNYFGYQKPYEGNAYVGGYCGTGAYREYVAVKLTAPMQIGDTYEVTIFASLADKSGYGTDNLGIYFFKDGPTTRTGSNYLPVTPQIDYSSYGVITDTANWTKLTGMMVADSAYEYMVIGGFRDANNIKTTAIPGNTGNWAYYYIDGFLVQLTSSFFIDYKDSLLCAGDTIQVGCKVVDKAYNSNNVFTAQLSDAAGAFTNPVNIGSYATDTTCTITCIIPKTVKNGDKYRIRLIASNSKDTSANNGIDIAIGNIDSANLAISVNAPLCEGNTLTLSATSSVGATKYLWTGPLGYSSTNGVSSLAGVSPINNGNYYAKADIYGCTVRDTFPVVVKPLPAKPVAGNNTPICAYDSLKLTSLSTTSGVTYSWTGPGTFTSLAKDTSFVADNVSYSGDYIVTADKNGCIRKDTTSVTIKPYPLMVNTHNNGPLCAGDSLELTCDTSSTGVSYTWSGPNGFSANTQNTGKGNVVVSTSGYYAVTIDLNGCVYQDSTNVVVHPIPSTPSASFASPICAGETLHLGATTVNGAAYTWSGPNSYSATTQNPDRSNVSVSDTGTYSVTATINGCTSPAGNVKVAINPVPFVVIFPNDDSICQGETAIFTALPNNSGGTPHYQWYINVQNTGITGQSFNINTLNDGDIVRCDMTENTKCSVPHVDPSNDVKMTVLPWLAPSVSIVADKTGPLATNEYIKFTATPVNAGKKPTYQWKRNGKDVIGAKGETWSANTLNDNDTVCVEVISNYRCPQPTTAMSNCIGVHVLTSVNDVNNTGNITLFPNPNNGKFTLKGKVEIRGEMPIAVYNAVGQVIYKANVVPENGILEHEINMDGIAKGMYMLRAGEYAVKFMVQ